MRWFKKKEKQLSYNKELEKPVIHASICNGEQVAGFKNLQTGDFTEVMFIRTPADMEKFRTMYGIEGDIPKEY